MLVPFSLQDVAIATKAHPRNLSLADLSRTISGITTDSRHIAPGQVFLALRGESFDGHDFVPAAIAAGAVTAIVEEPVADRLPQLVVANTQAAYQAISRAWRHRADASIVAITGSVGKTTMKELIAAVLATAGPVHKTEANFNNEIGVPKTLLQIRPEHRFAVIEMGMRGRGQIAELARCAQPDVAVITNVGTAHIGLLGSEQAIAEAKCELLAELNPKAIAILNADDNRLMATAAKVWPSDRRRLTYGLKSGDRRGELINGNILRVGDWDFPLPLPGRHNALNYLGALAVAEALGVSWEPLATGLAINLPDGRAQCHHLANDVQFLDETYNAGLESMRAALHLLAETPGQRRLAVLGTMKELGDRAPEFHREIGELARSLALDGLWVLIDQDDPTAEAIAAGAAPLAARCFTTHADLIADIQTQIQPGDRWLFKASHSVGLDRVVKALIQSIA